MTDAYSGGIHRAGSTVDVTGTPRSAMALRTAAILHWVKSQRSPSLKVNRTPLLVGPTMSTSLAWNTRTGRDRRRMNLKPGPNSNLSAYT